METARENPDLQLEDYSISQMTLDEVIRPNITPISRPKKLPYIFSLMESARFLCLVFVNCMTVYYDSLIEKEKNIAKNLQALEKIFR